MKKIFIALLSFFLIFGTTNAQLNLDDFESISFRNIGPAGMSGRVTAIDVDLSDSDRIFVGTASGGVWKSENGGVSWEPIFDDVDVLSIGSLKINQSNPDEIWVGTGEGNPRNSLNVGGGLYKSIDGGRTWSAMGMEKTRVIHRIIVHRDDPNVVLVGATGSPWGDSSERGVFKTTDGGITWDKILYVDQSTGVADMIVDPTNPNKILVAMWDHRRTPWDFVSGGEGSGLYLTYDCGDNWKKITDEEGLPKGELGRIGLAMSASSPNIIYALVEAEKNGLYKSMDGGENWRLVSEKNIGNRPFYYSEIYVDPQNENRIYNLWSYVSLSEDGGKTFRTIMDYGNNVHPDHHAFWIHPDDPSYLIDGNDGGMAISRDRGKSWQFVSNLPVGQFYHVNVDDDFPYNVYGGMQDNGSWVGPGFVLKSGGIRNYDWQELYFGDGFDVAADPRDNRYVYAMSQGGNLAYIDKNVGKSRFIKPLSSDTIPLRFNWNAALALDPHQECGVYYGSQYVHYSTDCGNSWKIISPDLTTNDTSKQKQHISGGLTIDATNAENHTTLLCIAPSVLEKEVIWASSDDGRLHVTRDGGDNWSEVGNRLPRLPRGSWIPQIQLSNSNPGEAWVVANDYRRNNFTPYAYHTTDYGRSWERIVDSRSVKSFVTSILQDPEEENLMFLGTDCGLYMSFDRGSSWQHWNKEMPSVQIRDMVIQSTFDDLVLGTFGRAFWVMDDLEVLREIASGNDFTQKDFDLMNSPDGYLTSYRSYDGIRFIAQGEYVGDNKSRASTINYWVKPTEDDDDKKKKEKIKVMVRSEMGDTVRTFSVDANEGFNKIYWGMNRDGVRFPSRRAPRGNDLPGGMPVLPGKYEILAAYGDMKDSVRVEVKMDPRVTMTADDMEAIIEVYNSHNENVELATKTYKNIKTAQATLDVIGKLLGTQPDSIQKKHKKETKEMRKSLKILEELYMDPEGLKGIQRNPNNLNSVMRTVNRYVGSSWTKPGPNAMIAFDKAEKSIQEVVTKVNSFFDEEWKPYREKIEGLSMSPFEEITKIEMPE